MRIKATQLRKGMIIEYNNDLYQLSEVLHITPGNWRAMIQTKMKSIRTGTNAEKRFRSDDIIVKADLETKEMEYLFQDGEMYTFMDIQTYDQVSLHISLVGDVALYILPNTKVLVDFYQGKPLSIELPGSVELKVVETEPALKTATVTSSYKPAVLETGLKVQVPPFISEGDIIRIDTSEGSYLERAK
jgi:elongation factor P